MSLFSSAPLSSEGYSIAGDNYPIEYTNIAETPTDISFDEVVTLIEEPNIATTTFAELENPTLTQNFTNLPLPPLSSVDLNYPYAAPYSIGELIDEDIRRNTQAMDELVDEIDKYNEEIEAELDKIPNHPWERFVMECVDPETYVPLRIQDIEIADDFCPSTYAPKITAIGEKFDEIADLHIAEFEKNSTRTDHIGNVFAVLSGDEFVLDKPKAVEFIKFAELIRNMPIELIEANPFGVASRLISHYVKING
jgi:hypothetical protein